MLVLTFVKVSKDNDVLVSPALVVVIVVVRLWTDQKNRACQRNIASARMARSTHSRTAIVHRVGARPCATSCLSQGYSSGRNGRGST